MNDKTMKQSTFAKLKATAQLLSGSPIVLGGLVIMGIGIVAPTMLTGFPIFLGGIVVASIGAGICRLGLESIDEAQTLQMMEEKNTQRKQATPHENTAAPRPEPLKTIKLNTVPVVKQASTPFASNNNFICRFFQKFHLADPLTPVPNLNNDEKAYMSPGKSRKS